MRAVRSRPAGAKKWLPAGPAARRFLFISFVDASGSGMFLAGSALFFTRVVGLSTAQIGVGLSIGGLCGLLASVPFGRLAEQYGNRAVLITLQIVWGAGFVAYLFADDFLTFAVVACVIGAAEWSAHPIIQALVGRTLEGQSFVRNMAVMTVFRNVGYSLGALAASVAIATSSSDAYRGLVLANGASFFVVAVLLIRIVEPPPASEADAAAEPKRRRILGTDGWYLLLTIGNGLLYLHSVILAVALPLWIIDRTTAPKVVVGLILVLNTVMAVTLQVRLSRGGDKVCSAAYKQRLAALALAVCCALVATTQSTGRSATIVLLLGAAAALTLGEIWQSAGAWGLSYQLAPERGRVYYLSVYSLGGTAASVVGPVLLATAVVDRGPAGWFALAGLFAAVGAVIPVVANIAQRRAERDPLAARLAQPDGP